MAKASVIRNCIFIIFYFFCLSCTSAQPVISLNKQNSSDYTIYISGTESHEKEAAIILQNYLQKISGIDLTIVSEHKGKQIFVVTAVNAEKFFPKIDTKDLSEDGVLLKNIESNVLITGGSNRGLTNAVCEFLERYLGCRYYADSAVLIPKQSVINIPAKFSYKYSPKIEYRYLNYNQAFKGSYAVWNKLTNLAGNPNTAKRPEWGLWVHSMFTLVPPEKYFKDHPEYYALRNGTRVKTQLCLTNPEVLKIAIANLSEIIKQHPDDQFFSVSQMDNNGYCQCDRCQRIAASEKSQSGPILQFVNKVAKAFPEKTISTLAYNYSRKAPAITKPEMNVNIFFCATGVNRAKPISSDKEPGSTYYDLMQWKAKTNNIFFWDYLIDFQHLYMPFPNYYILKPNIQLLASNNIPYTFQQGWAFSEGEMSELRCYIAAKLLWNPDIDVDSLIKEFTDYYYGSAGKFIYAYIKELNTNVQQNQDLVLTNKDAPFDHRKDYLSEQKIKKYKQFFTLATNAVKNEDPLYKKRVENASQSLRYTMLEVQAKEDDGDDSFYQNELDTFVTVASKEGSVLMNEGTMKVDDYYAQYNNYLKNKSVNNLAFNASAIITTPSGYSTNLPLSELFDNSRGSIVTDDKWVAFEKPYVELLIDLKKDILFDTISMRFIHDPNFLALLPEIITFSVSENNTSFTSIGNVKNSFNSLGVKKEIKTFELTTPGKVSARYIKIGIKLIAPSNYAGADRFPAMRCDEIFIH